MAATAARGSLGYQHHNVAGLGVLFASTLQLERDQQTLDASLTPCRAMATATATLPGSSWRTAGAATAAAPEETVCASRLRAPVTTNTTDGLTFNRERSTPMAATQPAPQALVARYDWTRRRVDSLLNPQRGHVLAAGGWAPAATPDQTPTFCAPMPAPLVYPLDKQAR